MMLAKQARTAMMIITRRTPTLAWAFVPVIVIISALVTSCIVPLYVIDPASKTPGYRIYSGSSEGLNITFEYPARWKRKSMEKYDAFVVVFFTADNVSASVDSDTKAGNGGEFESANKLIQHSENRSSEAPEFLVLHKGTVAVANMDWEELVYSFRLKSSPYDPHLPVGTVIDKTVISRELAVDYKDRIYSISLLTDYDRYENVEEGFDHLLSTFRFLE